MILSDDNLGRLQATVFAMNWGAVGAAVAFVALDVARVVNEGAPGFRRAAISLFVLAGLVWLVRGALESLEEVRETVRDDHSPVPRPVIHGVLLVSALVGAAIIAFYRLVVLHGLPQSAVGFASVTGALAFALVVVPACILLAGLSAWFVVFPNRA